MLSSVPFHFAWEAFSCSWLCCSPRTWMECFQVSFMENGESLIHFCLGLIPPRWSDSSSFEAFNSIFSHMRIRIELHVAHVGQQMSDDLSVHGKVPLTLSPFLSPVSAPCCLNAVPQRVWCWQCSTGTDYRAYHMADLTTISCRGPSGSCGFLGCSANRSV